MVLPENHFTSAYICCKSFVRRKCRILLIGLFSMVYLSVYIRYNLTSFNLSSEIPIPKTNEPNIVKSPKSIKSRLHPLLETVGATAKVHHSPPFHWPRVESAEDDRILLQMRYSLPPQFVPPGREFKYSDKKSTKYVEKGLVYLPHGIHSWYVRQGTNEFSSCPVSQCSLTDNRLRGSKASAVLFRDNMHGGPDPRPDDQVWVFYTLESPKHTEHLGGAAGLINWTATYRWDSDLVTPYARFATFESLGESVDDKLRKHIATEIDYIKDKTKDVAWFVSNCNTPNRRLQYAKELSKHIQVDIYGRCGAHVCSRHDPNCNQMLKKHYHFYLAFENSNCRDYISEKLFSNAYENLAIPIVMGAPKEDYTRQAPPHSFIHVDDFDGPIQLAEYLTNLTSNATSYNAYFAWRRLGTFIDTKFWCRLCAMIHAPNRGRQSYLDLETWWRPTGICRNEGSWNATRTGGSNVGPPSRQALIKSTLQLIKRLD